MAAWENATYRRKGDRQSKDSPANKLREASSKQSVLLLGAKGSLTKTEEQRLTSVGTGKPQHSVIPTIFLCLVIQEGRRGRVHAGGEDESSVRQWSGAGWTEMPKTMEQEGIG